MTQLGVGDLKTLHDAEGSGRKEGAYLSLPDSLTFTNMSLLMAGVKDITSDHAESGIDHVNGPDLKAQFGGPLTTEAFIRKLGESKIPDGYVWQILKNINRLLCDAIFPKWIGDGPFASAPAPAPAPAPASAAAPASDPLSVRLWNVFESSDCRRVMRRKPTSPTQLQIVTAPYGDMRQTTIAADYSEAHGMAADLEQAGLDLLRPSYDLHCFSVDATQTVGTLEKLFSHIPLMISWWVARGRSSDHRNLDRLISNDESVVSGILDRIEKMIGGTNASPHTPQPVNHAIVSATTASLPTASLPTASLPTASHQTVSQLTIDVKKYFQANSTHAGACAYMLWHEASGSDWSEAEIDQFVTKFIKAGSDVMYKAMTSIGKRDVAESWGLK